MSQTLPPNTFLASDGKLYTMDGKYVLQNNDWIPCQSVGHNDTSSQQNQFDQAQSGPSVGPGTGDDISAAMHAQFGQVPPSQPQLPRQPATTPFQPTGRPAAPPIELDPCFRAAKDRHIMIGAFVDASDAISGRKG
ncbi:uncharacterized protein K460DRAFT_360596 [Cucurbitaria berberidis CBS 394.84]|uniref:Uncharacterized protein n=1 Tax=Cucurbitaria berberidis CBS 394.84 TaxID=1168544 RepID=A0A9P4GR22_9PLEO|nr:uncharacterized protein K460DRAFT_360596 [Cucurbitaria berberidis CBS 394.84]KAF1849744.1 hypothetical protein K460DRAFT_360596 [Cucurbitaria berberidis CBS 394.84]